MRASACTTGNDAVLELTDLGIVSILDRLGKRVQSIARLKDSLETARKSVERKGKAVFVQQRWVSCFDPLDLMPV